MEQIRILLVDDQMLFVESLRTVIETRSPDIKVVGVAHDGAAALQLVASLQPDVILMDVRMPKMDGVESTRRIKEQFPEARVLMLTTFDDDHYVVEALRLGAVGYLLKDMPPAELISAVKAVHEGGVLISPKVATKLVAKLSAPPAAKPPETPEQPKTTDPVFDLSSREQEILQLMAAGLDNREIAAKLYIAEQTVKNYVSIIYSKLGVRDRVQASRLAIEAELDKRK
ncbi:MAG TPA: response regulator transcription factor [Bacillota bacterium]|nr:response regulator transcription factor [Bacillota bacterium]